MFNATRSSAATAVRKYGCDSESNRSFHQKISQNLPLLSALLFILAACTPPTVPLVAKAPEPSWPSKAASLIEAYRRSRGCLPIRWNQPGATVAEAYARQMSDQQFFGHVDPNGRTLVERLDKAGIDWHMAGETIAAGMSTPEQVVEGWIKSPEHRAVLEDCSFAQLGLGFHHGTGPYKDYWTAVFLGE
jgi:uncharacterized protein YkwD